jgi:hypothetical protein
MPDKSFWDHPIEKLEEALSIRKQIAQVEEVLKELFGPNPKPATGDQSSVSEPTGQRTMSPEAREKIAAAQRARWAKSKSIASPAKAVKAPKKAGGISPEGRAKLAAAMKARWAARKKGAPALNAPAKATVATPAKKAKRNISPEARAKMAEAAKMRWAKVKG